MSDIIDINVYETTEDVTINVTENVINVNINKVTSSGGGGTWGSITGDLVDQTDLQSALNLKVDKVTGKGLSTNDFTNTLKTKLDGLDDANLVHKTGDETIQGVKNFQDRVVISSDDTALSAESFFADHFNFGDNKAILKNNGNLLLNTTADDGFNKLQVNGSIKISDTFQGNYIETNYGQIEFLSVTDLNDYDGQINFNSPFNLRSNVPS